MQSALQSEDSRDDDQRALGLTHTLLRDLVCVDTHCRVFLNLNPREWANGLPKDFDPVFVGHNGGSWKRGRKALTKQGTHVSRLLFIDTAICALVCVLGICWGGFQLPTPCVKFPLFPFLVGMCCFFSPRLSVSTASVLFLASLFAISYTYAT